MSQLLSHGAVDVGRWAGVASDVAAFLARWLECPDEIDIPKGRFRAAERFLSYALNGIAPTPSERAWASPPLAGVSNSAIATEVLCALDPVKEPTPPEVAHRLRSILTCLQVVRDHPNDANRGDVRGVKEFFEELHRQAETSVGGAGC